MYAAKVEHAIERIPGLADNGAKVAHAIHNAVLGGSDQLRKAVDILHGTWLGHPLHPVLTDIPIGAWTIAMMCDLVATQRGSDEAAKMADTLNATGNRERGVLLSTIAFGAVNLSGWIGGEMLFNRKIGVNHATEASGPASWQAALGSADLPERTPKRVEIEGAPVLLYRDGTSVYAIGAVCSHAGGPLDEGTITNHCVECPWHNSVFDLRDGSIVHGPATFPEPAYDARMRNGQIEVRVRPVGAGG